MPKKRKSSPIRSFLRWSWIFLLLSWVVASTLVVSLRFVNPPLTAGMLWERIKKSDPAMVERIASHWRPLEEISPDLRRAVLAGEDQRFLSHHGFDFVEIERAARDILEKKGYRGASTISMQVARTIFLWRGRSWVRKIAEAYCTLLIEISCSKERILEIYLNTVDWGRGIMGAEAASRKYFHTSASQISRSQAALLAAALPNPHGWSPARPDARVLRRQKRILKDLGKMPLVGR